MTNIEVISATRNLLRITFPSGKRKEMTMTDLLVKAEEMEKFARTERDQEMKARLLRNAEAYRDLRNRAGDMIYAERGY